MPVVAIRKSPAPEPPPQPGDAAREHVQATQKAIDELPLNSGIWRISGVPGLYLRSRRTTKSFYIQRKIKGRLVRKNLGPLPMREAKAHAMSEWGRMKGQTSGAQTFADCFRLYLESKGAKLRERTRENYQYEFDTYLQDLHRWSMKDLGSDEGRTEMQRQQARIRKKHGAAAANRAMRLVSAVYRKARKTDSTLPLESPTKAIDLDVIKPRDSALSDEELSAWGRAVAKLGALKKMWWITCLLTGARQSSIDGLKWADVDLDKKIIKFWKAKRGAYVVPMSDILARLLTRYRDAGEVAPSDEGWIFPSPRAQGRPLQRVREKPERGICGPHALRHTFKTRGVGAISAEVSKILMGQGGSGKDQVNYNYISLALVVEPLRPAINWCAASYAEALGELLGVEQI
jgi:integrase